MGPTKLQRSGALLASAALLASLTVASVAAPAAAQLAPCNGQLPTLVGTPGDDPGLIGTNGDDVIVGLGGNDIIDGLDGNDTICGDDGRDTIYGGEGDDTILGGEGRDTIFGGDGRDSLLGGDLRGLGGDLGDKIFGGLGPDFIWGQQGPDVIKGGPGSDTIRGGPGNDRIFGGAAADLLVGGLGRDLVDGGAGFDDCTHWPNPGSIRNCEAADFKVSVSSPATGTRGADIRFTIRVTNLGPSRADYTLDLKVVDDYGASCGSYPWEGPHWKDPLRRRQTRIQRVTVNCGAGGIFSNSRIAIIARVTTTAKDRRSDNSKARSWTKVIR